MKFKDWFRWVKSLPPWKKWFIYLILLRPFIDPFWSYELPVLAVSPLEVIGVLTPGIIIITILTRQLPSSVRSSKIDRIFLYWNVFIVINAIFLLLFRPTVDTFGTILKITLPGYLYYYLRHFINSEKDLYGILATALIAAVIPACMVLYEITLGPVSISKSRGLERISGFYADLFTYAIYLSLSVLITGFFLLSKGTRLSLRQKRRLTSIVLIMSVTTLLKINHTASYGVFTAIIGLFVLHNLKQKEMGNLVFIFLLMGLGAFLVKNSVEKNVSRLISSDLAVLRGEADIGRAFHGRMSRWQRYGKIFNRMSVFQQLFGASIGQRIRGPGMISAGMHNDYLRITFLSGLVGLFTYLLFLTTIFLRSRSLNNAYKFLVSGALLIVAMYSISATPSFYATMMYIILSIFAFVSLPPAQRAFR